MHQTSALYQEILRNPAHEKEIKLDIAGVEYLQNLDEIISVSTSGGIFSRPDIGGCTSRQIDLEVYPKGDIPRQAKIRVFARLKLGTQVSEWIPKGVFFISTRHRDRRTGTLSIHGFDAMLKANAYWLTTDYPEGYLPKTEVEAVQDIASRIGVQVDSRTSLNNVFPVNYDEAGNEDKTMTDILGYIAVANAGNWVISDKGELLLLKYGDIPPETNYLVTEDGDAITFGGVRILVG